MVSNAPLLDSIDVWITDSEFNQVDQSKVALFISNLNYECNYALYNDPLCHFFTQDQFEQCISLINDALSDTRQKRICMTLLCVNVLILSGLDGAADDLLGFLFVLLLMGLFGLLAWCCGCRVRKLDSKMKARVINCLTSINEQLLNPSIDQSDNQTINQSTNSKAAFVSSLVPCYFLLVVTNFDTHDNTIFELFLMDPNRSISQPISQPTNDSVHITITDEQPVAVSDQHPTDQSVKQASNQLDTIDTESQSINQPISEPHSSSLTVNDPSDHNEKAGRWISDDQFIPH